MTLIQTVNHSELYDIAHKMGRGSNYGHDGWRAIGDYLEELSEDMGENIEIDIIAICCEYCFAGSADEFYDEYEKMNIAEEDWQEMGDNEKLVAIQSI